MVTCGKVLLALALLDAAQMAGIPAVAKLTGSTRTARVSSDATRDRVTILVAERVRRQVADTIIHAASSRATQRLPSKAGDALVWGYDARVDCLEGSSSGF